MMDYWPNTDAVSWFAQEIFPLVRMEVPAAEFFVVGARPTSHVMALRQIDGVHVTGAVPDVRPYLAGADAVVAPLRVARGIQNKVLEGMSMARPVIATTQAMEGIAARHGEQVLIAGDMNEFVRFTVATLLGREHDDLGARARSFVLANHDWTANLRVLNKIIDGKDVHAASLPQATADEG
jgi:glycosyltransferase involved in cell wall biosynthesis